MFQSVFDVLFAPSLITIRNKTHFIYVSCEAIKYKISYDNVRFIIFLIEKIIKLYSGVLGVFFTLCSVTVKLVKSLDPLNIMLGKYSSLDPVNILVWTL